VQTDEKKRGSRPQKEKCWERSKCKAEEKVAKGAGVTESIAENGELKTRRKRGTQR